MMYVYVAVNMADNVKYESFISQYRRIERTDIDFYASSPPRHVQHS
jgi:hypothetical protein